MLRWPNVGPKERGLEPLSFSERKRLKPNVGPKERGSSLERKRLKPNCRKKEAQAQLPKERGSSPTFA